VVGACHAPVDPKVSLLIKKQEEIAGKIRDKDGLLFLNTLCYNVTTSDKTDKTTKLSVFVYPMKNHILIAI
jgi:hypothetical protein